MSATLPAERPAGPSARGTGAADRPARRGGPVDPRLLRAARSARPAIAVATGIGVAMSVAVVVQAVALASVIGGAFGGRTAASQLLPGLCTLVAAVVVRAALGWLAELAAQRGGAAVTVELRARLLDRLLDRGPAWLSGHPVGEVATLATTGLDALDEYFGRYLPQLVLAAVVPAVILVWVVFGDWLSAVVLGATLLVLPVFMVLLGHEAEARMARQWELLHHLGGHFLDLLRGLPTLRSFGRASAQLAAIGDVTDRLRRATIRTLRFAFLSSLVLELLASVSTALVAILLGLRLIDGRMHLATALAVLLLAPEVYLPLRRASAQYHAAAAGVGASAQVLDLLADPVPATPGGGEPRRGDGTGRFAPRPRVTSRPRREAGGAGAAEPAPRTTPGGALPGAGSPAIRLDGVTLRYPGRDRPVLEGIDLELGAGERIALVGASGTGKSSILALLLGFLEPAEGRVLVDGRDLACLPVEEWRRRLSWLPQQPTWFRGTVAENLRMGRPEASALELWEALRDAGADGVLAGLPDGLEARFGEGGVGCSVGERQRLALARAFVRPDALLLLDEPTSHLDAAAERSVAQGIGRQTSGRGAVVVTHRVGLLEQLPVERVLRVEGGRVVEAGGARAW